MTTHNARPITRQAALEIAGKLVQVRRGAYAAWASVAIFDGNGNTLLERLCDSEGSAAFQRQVIVNAIAAAYSPEEQ